MKKTEHLIAPSAFALTVGVSPKGLLLAIDAGRFSKKVLVKKGKRQLLRNDLARAEWFAYKGIPDPLLAAGSRSAGDEEAPEGASAQGYKLKPASAPASGNTAPFDLDPEDEGNAPPRMPPRKLNFPTFPDEEEDEDGDENGGTEWDARLGVDLPRGSLNQLRTRNEAIKAARAEVELKKSLAILVPVESVRRGLYAIGQEVRSRFEAMPARIVDACVGKDRFVIQSVMEEEINKILAHIADLGNREFIPTDE